MSQPTRSSGAAVRYMEGRSRDPGPGVREPASPAPTPRPSALFVTFNTHIAGTAHT